MHRPCHHVAVIGGGLAGLAAAESLLAASPDAALPPRSVTIVEPSGRPGGVIATVRRDGWLVERSADSFLGARPEAVTLIERLGLADELTGVAPRARRALVLCRGRPMPVPPGFRLLAPGNVSAIVATPLLTPWSRLRVLAERFIPRRDLQMADESLEQFAVRRLGRQAFERLVQPLAAGIWTADPRRLSMAAACPEFFAMEAREGSLWRGERSRARSGTQPPAAGARYGQFLTLASGMEALPRRMAEQLTARGAIFTSAAATMVVKRSDGRWDIHLDRPADTGRAVIDADAVVVAVPAAPAARLVRPFDPELAQALAAIEYAGSTIVSIGFSRTDVAHPLDAAGLVVPRREGRRILAVSFSSQKFPGRAPPGDTLMRAFVGGALDPEATALDDTRVVSLVLEEISDILGVRGNPKLIQVDRWAGAMPQYHVGHVDRVATIARHAARHPGLAMAGAAYEGVGIPQVIASGQAAAAAILAAANDG